MRRALSSLSVIVGLAGPAPAQDRTQTLADIRQDLSVQLNVEIQGLRRELSTTGDAGLDVSGSGITGRLDAIEAELCAADRPDRGAAEPRRPGRDRRHEPDRRSRVPTGRTGRRRSGRARRRRPRWAGVELPQTAAPASRPRAPATGRRRASLPWASEAISTAPRTPMTRATTRRRRQLFADLHRDLPGRPADGRGAFPARRGAERSLGQDTARGAGLSRQLLGHRRKADVAPAALLQLGLSLDRLGQLSEACVTLGEVDRALPGVPGRRSRRRRRARNLGCV